MPEKNFNIPLRRKAVYFEEEDLYGYAHSVVYNETIKNCEHLVINTDVAATSKNLHNKAALDYAAKSLGEDIE